MATYLKWLGCIFILLFALLLGREYSAYLKRKKDELAGYISALLHIEKMIESYLATPSEIFRDFDSVPLEKNGFLPAVRSKKTLYEAFRSAKASLLSADSSACLGEYFKDFGKGYREREISRTRAAAETLRNISALECEEIDKSSRIGSVLLLGAAAGLTILII